MHKQRWIRANTLSNRPNRRARPLTLLRWVMGCRVMGRWVMGCWVLGYAVGYTVGCTKTAASADNSVNPVSSAMPTVVVAAWKQLPSASASAHTEPLDLSKPDDVHKFLLAQAHGVPHESCEPMLQEDGSDGTLAAVIRSYHRQSTNPRYHCEKRPDGYFSCTAEYPAGEPEPLLIVEFETTAGLVPQLKVQSVRCTPGG